MEEQFNGIEEIQELYSVSEVPVLSQAAQVAIRQILLEQGCKNVGGALVFSNRPTSHEVKSVLGRLDLQVSNTFYGPYFLGEQYEIYYPNGIGIYTMQQR